MKLSFSKLGPLETGEVTLNDLTVLCGQNNTGKTYVTYALYCYLKCFAELITPSIRDKIPSLRQNGVITFDVDEMYGKRWPDVLVAAQARFKARFPAMMASNKALFAGTTVKLEFSLSENWKAAPFERELRSERGKLVATLKKPANSATVSVGSLNTDSGSFDLFAIETFLEEALTTVVLRDVLPSVFMASSERTGATIFRKDLNLTKNSLTELIGRMHAENRNELEFGRIFDVVYSRNYAKPVDDNVKFANALPETTKQMGPFAEAHPHLVAEFEAIAGGSYQTTKDGQASFSPKRGNVKLGLGETSSAVRSLMIIWYWLKYIAKEGDLIMIDEPELNLHLANQRALARFLAKLIDHKIRVFITTHSDTIIREFNTLIMLRGAAPERRSEIRVHGYDPSEGIGADKISVFVTCEESVNVPGKRNKVRRRILKKIDADPIFGVDIESFDSTILEMTKVQEDIRFGLAK